MILKYCNTLESSLKRAGGIFCAAFALTTGGMALAADEVSFKLTFADRPLPDLKSFTALRACGSAVQYEVDHYQCGIICSWFMRAIYYHCLPMKYTFAGYAQHLRRYYDWSKVKGTLSTDELSERATEICLAIQKRELEYQKKYGPKITEQDTFVNVQATCLPTGSPFPFELPRARGACDSEVVWDGVFADLMAQFGPNEEKRKILEVEVEYDRARRLGCGRIPIPVSYDAVVASRFTYRAGVGGEEVARLEVKYPGWLFACSDPVAIHYHDPLTIFTLGEWQKAGNRGRTIQGRFRWCGKSHPCQIFVDGQKAPVLEVFWPSANIMRQGAAVAATVKGLEEVDANVYSGREYLEKITLKPGVKRIAPFAFCGCRLLSHITLPEGLESIGNAAFKGCYGLSRIEIPNSVTNVGAWAFRDCGKLQEVKFPAGLREIPDGLFYRYYNFGEFCLEQFVVPEGVERIGKYAFYGNRKLGEVRVPKSVREIGDYAFCNCTSLTNVVFEGESRPKIGEGAFRGCERLKGL